MTVYALLIVHLKNEDLQAGLLVQACNRSPREPEAGGSQV
jgi:hypothetical protein